MGSGLGDGPIRMAKAFTDRTGPNRNAPSLTLWRSQTRGLVYLGNPASGAHGWPLIPLVVVR